MMADPIFREIDEEVRRENILKLWRRFRYWIIGSVVTVIVFVAGGLGIMEYREIQRQDWGDHLLRSLQSADEEGAAAALDRFTEIADDASGSYRILSLFNEAAMQARLGNTEEAIKIYNDLQSFARPDHLRDLATLLWAYYQLDGNNDADLKTRLVPLTGDDSAWKYSAREIMAFLAYRRGGKDQSRILFKELESDPQSPEGIRTRAKQMLAVLGQ